MTVMLQPQGFHPVARELTQGIRVDRPTDTLPQTAAEALFTVTGGRVLVIGIVGEVTTAVQAQANATKLQANPTTGTTVDVCATLDITGDEVGCLYGITGVFGDAMIGANAGATVWPTRPFVANVGSIDLNCAASNTGAAKWSLVYVPLDDGAEVVAA
jgi:hypothetical protein